MVDTLTQFQVLVPYAGPMQMRVCDIESVSDLELLDVIEDIWQQRLQHEQNADWRGWSRDAEDLCHLALDMVLQRRKTLQSAGSSVVSITSKKKLSRSI